MSVNEASLKTRQSAIRSAKPQRSTARPSRGTNKPDEAYADWPGDFQPVRLPWPPGSDAKP